MSDPRAQNTENEAAFKEIIKGTVIGEIWGKHKSASNSYKGKLNVNNKARVKYP